VARACAGAIGASAAGRPPRRRQATARHLPPPDAPLCPKDSANPQQHARAEVQAATAGARYSPQSKAGETISGQAPAAGPRAHPRSRSSGIRRRPAAGARGTPSPRRTRRAPRRRARRRPGGGWVGGGGEKAARRGWRRLLAAALERDRGRAGGTEQENQGSIQRAAPCQSGGAGLRRRSWEALGRPRGRPRPRRAPPWRRLCATGWGVGEGVAERLGFG
jgi:hypothetical protein